jgi:hypothetical protein
MQLIFARKQVKRIGSVYIQYCFKLGLYGTIRTRSSYFHILKKCF